MEKRKVLSWVELTTEMEVTLEETALQRASVCSEVAENSTKKS